MLNRKIYHRYAHAIQLNDEDKAILQAMHIWIQTYFKTILFFQGGADFPLTAPTTNPSYSELWWLTKYYEQLRAVFGMMGGGGLIMEKHRELYSAFKSQIFVILELIEEQNEIFDEENIINTYDKEYNFSKEKTKPQSFPIKSIQPE